MNQNMPRQITPEEINQQLSKEELHKTQVLNLKEVEEVARFEKRTSKKPAIIVAIIGIISICFGTTFSLVQSFNSNNKQKVEPRKETIIPEENETNLINNNESTLNCVIDSLNNADGTDTTLTVTLNFENDKLVSVNKLFNINAIKDNPLAQTTLNNYAEAYTLFMNPIPGYDIAVNQTENMISVNVDIDYNTLDLNLLSPTQATHFSTSVDYQKGTDKTTINNDYIQKGYTCN